MGCRVVVVDEVGKEEGEEYVEEECGLCMSGGRRERACRGCLCVYNDTRVEFSWWHKPTRAIRHGGKWNASLNSLKESKNTTTTHVHCTKSVGFTAQQFVHETLQNFAFTDRIAHNHLLSMFRPCLFEGCPKKETWNCNCDLTRISRLSVICPQ